MAGEVVGTAFVRIKALTKGLAKDIEKSVKKGMEGAKLDKVGETEGKKMGTAMGDATVDSAGDTIKKRSGDIVPDSVFDDMRKKAKDANPLGDLFGGDELKENLDRQVSTVFEGMDRINDNIRKKWSVGDGDGPIDFDEWGKEAKENGGIIEGVLNGLSAKMKGMSGPGFGGGFLTKAIGGVGAAVTAALPYIQDLGAGVLAYATGIVAQLGFLTTAAVGLGAAAGAALGSALLPLGPLLLAFKSETEALVEFKDSLKAAGEEFMRIGTATQATLLPALDDAIFQMGELVPMFSEFGLYVGHAVGNYAKLAAAVLTGEMAQGRFSAILESSYNILNILLPTLINVGNILSGLWVAAIPASERFVGSLADMVARWRDIVNFGLFTGTLTDTLNTWYDRAQLVGSALGNLAGALFDILSVGADSSDTVFVRFDEWAERYRAWTESEVGQNKLKLIFDNSLAVMREVNAVAVELFEGVFGRLDEIGGVDSMVSSLQDFRDIIPEIKETVQGFIDQVRGINSVIGPQIWNKITQAFEQLRDPIGKVVVAVMDLFSAMEESGAFETFLDLVEAMADILATLLAIPGFGTFIGYLIAFGGAAKVLSFALGPLVAVLGPFIGLLAPLATGMKAFAAVKVGTTFLDAAKGIFGFASASKGAKAAADGIMAAGKATGAAGSAVRAGGLVSSLTKVGPLLAGLGVPGIVAAGVIAGVGASFFLAKKRAQEFEQDVRQVTSALGTLNGGLNITAEGIRKYIDEESRFAGNDQIDDLNRMGFTLEGLAHQVANGTISYREFTNAAIESGEVHTRIRNVEKTGYAHQQVSKSLEELQKQYKLTDVQVAKLAHGSEVYAKDGTQLVIRGNDSIVESFEELNEAIGRAAKDSLDDFSTNAQNVRLLGARAVADIVRDVGAASDDTAGQKMADAMERLGRAAAEDSKQVTGLTDAMRDQISAQVSHLTGVEKMIAENALLRSEQEKLFTQIRANYEVFKSNEFAVFFRDAKREVVEFSDVMKNVNFENFQLTAAFSGVDALIDNFPLVGTAALELFDQLQGLPEKEFNAAAQAINADAESLRTAMNGAQQAIIDLQQTALSTLPSIQEALDDNLKTEEDGTQYFDTKGFTTEANKRINETTQFAEDLQYIHDTHSEEAARAALAQGPESARALSVALATDPDAVNGLLFKMEMARNSVSQKVRELFGPGVAAEYLATVKPVGDSIGLGLTAGLNNPATAEALGDAGAELLNMLVRGFRGRFEWKDNQLSFIKTGEFRRAVQTQLRRRKNEGFSEGGYVPGGTGQVFGTGPGGTDTVPAWLTPGEFVLRKSIAQAIPPNILNALNAGDSRLMSLLTTIGNNRPGSPNATNALTVVPTGAPRAGVVIENMTVVAPSPLDAARQTVNRLRIMQAQSTGV